MNHNMSSGESHETHHDTHSCASSGNNSPTHHQHPKMENIQAESKDAYCTTDHGAGHVEHVSKTDHAKLATKSKPQKLTPQNRNIYSDSNTAHQSPRTKNMPSNSDHAGLPTGIAKGSSVPNNHSSRTTNQGPGSGTSSRSDSLESTSAPSFRPHTGGDVRWDAINNMVSKSGPLNVSHFRLLKRIGYGDIGSVYLAELKGTNAHFAMKVMDKAALISRNKLLRAQTEREILGLLDHPFLPTLYSYFETDKFYCLVMEFCSGGDLHSLRQKQPNQCFTEEAARLVEYLFAAIFLFCSSTFLCIYI